MPIGGSNIGWDNTTPADTENAGQGDDRIRSLKTSIQEGLDNEHNWASSGGANTGYHRLGSARPYYGTQSIVSSSGTDGRLMVTSDTSRLFHVGSGGTMLLGAWTVPIVSGGDVAAPQRAYWAIELGETQTSAGSVVVTFPNSGFSGAPYIQLVPVKTTSLFAWSVWTVTATTFSINDGASSRSFHWLSFGTRTL